MDYIKLAAEGFSVIAGICLWISILAPSQRRMVAWQSAECSFRVIGVLLLGGVAGAYMLFFCVVRNLGINFVRSRGNEKAARWILFAAFLAQLVSGIVTYEAWYDSLTIISSVVFTLGLMNEEIVFTKANIFQNMACWFLYSIFINGWVMIATYGIMTVTAAITLKRTIKAKKSAENAGV